jgi:peptidoglycan/xylan/chitin deacetylase (PgdA/CDA1 family)
LAASGDLARARLRPECASTADGTRTIITLVPESTVSVTFDNLGEAAQLELGMWPADVPEGEHFSVVQVLPRLLELLAARHLQATFFIEGLNAEMYPQALHSILEAGHEIAVHAWRHEQWATLSAAAEAELLRRATDAMRAIGIHPRGFRPPGGGLTERTISLLSEHGYYYVSPAGEREGLLDGLAVLPFRWPLVDAYAYLPQFASLRERHGDGPDPNPPEEMRAEMIAALHRHAATGGDGHLALIFHPFTAAFTGEPGWEALDEVLGEVARLSEAGTIGALRMDEAAARILALPAERARPPRLDESTWTAP